MARIFALSGINQDALIGTDGDDIVRGTSTSPGIWNGRRGTIQLLGGDDRIRSRSFIRIRGETMPGSPRVRIDLGAGRDMITGRSILSLGGVDDRSPIFRWVLMRLDLGPGADTVSLPTGKLLIGEASILETGDGPDRIQAKEISMRSGSADCYLSTGDGGDQIVADEVSLSMSGFVRTGDDDDRIDVEGGVDLTISGIEMGRGDDVLQAGYVYLSQSYVDMGSGNDIVDTGRGGLGQDNEGNVGGFFLGPGDDRFIGFSMPSQGRYFASVLDGEAGKDTLKLPKGVYIVKSDLIRSSQSLLPVKSIEFLEGISGGRFPYAPGILTVDNNGMASFAAALA
jgi:hypothetical protein